MTAKLVNVWCVLARKGCPEEGQPFQWCMHTVHRTAAEAKRAFPKGVPAHAVRIERRYAIIDDREPCTVGPAGRGSPRAALLEVEYVVLAGPARRKRKRR